MEENDDYINNIILMIEQATYQREYQRKDNNIVSEFYLHCSADGYGVICNNSGTRIRQSCSHLVCEFHSHNDCIRCRYVINTAARRIQRVCKKMIMRKCLKKIYNKQNRAALLITKSFRIVAAKKLKNKLRKQNQDKIRREAWTKKVLHPW